MAHTTVLLKEAIGVLDLREGDIYLDATLGGGGHAEEVYKRFGQKVEILGIDADESALEIARARLELAGAKPKLLVHNFRQLDKAVEILGSTPNKILFDLGWNSMQFEGVDGESGSGRGFSFKRDEPLIMTFGTPNKDSITAEIAINAWGEESLAQIIFGYGEEKHARRIAKAIVEARDKKPIKTSLELATIVSDAVPMWYRFQRIHPATRTFQAIRIAVNDELQALKEGVENAFKILKQNGRIAVISFHSLEDRIVKHFFKSNVEEGKAEYIEDCGRKPILPTEEEINQNHRSRSAKLRVIRKI